MEIRSHLPEPPAAPALRLVVPAHERLSPPDFKGLMLRAAAELRAEAKLELDLERRASLQKVAEKLVLFANESADARD